MPYTRVYAGGWQDLPNTSTPILAAGLTHIEDGIAAAQTTAETALGGDGGGFVVVPGLALNGQEDNTTPTDDAPAIQTALEGVEDGDTGGHLFVTGPAGSVGYLNSTITMAANGTILEFDPAVRWRAGSEFRLRPWGTIQELPIENPAKPALTADAPAGATVLHVDKIPEDWVAGIYVGLRGKRTASGSVPNSEIFHSYVASIDRPGLTITLVDPLPKEYKALWDTTWSNKLSQLTVVVSSKMTGTPDAGDTVINVETASIFHVKDVIRISDDLHTIDGDGTIRTGNFIHRQVAYVVEIIDGTTIRLASPLQHTYSLSDNARVERLEVLRDAEVRGLHLGFAQQQADGQHAIEVRYALNTRISGFNIEGGGDTLQSWSGHAIRFTDSLWCAAYDGVIANPSVVTAGRGYGVTFYGSSQCWVHDVSVSGCRHSFLWFNGSNGCEVRDCISTDARISDYDWHGAEEANNRTIGCTAQGGTRSTGDSDGRTAWKYGNPSQTNGAFGNSAIDCLVVDYHGTAVEHFPRSADSVWQGVVRGATVGIKMSRTPIDGSTYNDTALHDGFTVRDSEFYDVLAPLSIDGGPSGVTKRFVLEKTTFTRCGPLQIMNTPQARIQDVKVINPSGTGWQIMAWSCNGIQIQGCNLSGSPKGIAVTSSTDARVVFNTLHDISGPEWYDGGGNTNSLFRSNEIHPGTGSYTRASTASTGITQQTMTDGGTESIGSATTGSTYDDPEDDYAPPSGGGGGSGGTVPLIGRSGMAWNSGVARWDSGTPANDVTLANGFGTWRGRLVDGFLHFPPRQTWADVHATPPSAWSSWPGYIVNSLPPQPETEGGGSNAATAAGTNNSRWAAYGTTLANAGLNTSRYIVRLGWECNGYWFKWSWGDENGAQTPQNSAASFVQAVQNVSTSLKSTAPNVQISICLNRGSKRSGTAWQSVIDPLIGYIDILSLDHYDWYPGQTNSTSFNSAKAQQPGLGDMPDYCRSKGIQFAVEEWGLVSSSGGSAGGAGGDNPYFITSMYSEFAAASDVLAYEGYYEDQGAPSTLEHRMIPGNYPSAAAAYRASTRWGS